MPLSSGPPRQRYHRMYLLALCLALIAALSLSAASASADNQTLSHPPASHLAHWDGSHWLGTSAGLFRIETGSAESRAIAGIGPVQALLADEQALLVLDRQHLWVLAAGRPFQQLPLPAEPRQLLPARLGCACWWLRTGGGLSLLQRIGEHWKVVPLPGAELTADAYLLKDDGEWLWVLDAGVVSQLPSLALLGAEAPAGARWTLAGARAVDPAQPSPASDPALRADFWRGAATATLLALLLAGVVRYESARRERRLARERQQELDRQVQRRTADLEIANRQLRDLADTDALTGVSNRRHFDRLLREGFERALLTRRPLSVLMIDADQFKSYNDQHGHLAGDDALRALGQCLQQAVRSDTVVARFGGEEFAVIAPSGRREAHGLAERLRRTVERDCPTTVSIGTATLDAGKDRDEPALLARADRALYAAKAAGRNRVASAEDAAVNDFTPRTKPPAASRK
ncbi:MAG: GGDEF domain-containing protein [Aquimonas sp.]|nr:GGDEF domain-containing protein [Aquimonas sp.]